MSYKRRQATVLVFIGLFLWAYWFVKVDQHTARLQYDKVPKDFWGVTFSKKYADEIGIDWRAAYVAMLDDLQVKNVRLPVYWPDIEPKKDEFSFADYDWMLAEGSKRNVHFILNLGRRLPRWPECHQPSWTTGMPTDEMDARHLNQVKVAIEHFKNVVSIQYWQLENEYFFPWFGECPKGNPELIKTEIGYLKANDARPLILTDSGELNSWKKAAQLSDVLGITIYRVVWNNYFGYFRHPWPAALYRIKAALAGKTRATTIVAELQAEPWPTNFRKPVDITPEEANRSFSLKQFETNAEIARRTGFHSAYFWGAEWWYWLKQKGDASMWNMAKKIITYGSETKAQ